MPFIIKIKDGTSLHLNVIGSDQIAIEREVIWKI